LLPPHCALLAKTSKSTSKLEQALLDVGLPSSAETKTFASDLFARIGRSAPSSSSTKKSAGASSSSAAGGLDRKYGLLLEEEVVSGGGLADEDRRQRKEAKAARRREKELAKASAAGPSSSSSASRRSGRDDRDAVDDRPGPSGSHRRERRTRKREDEGDAAGAWESDEEDRAWKRAREDEEDAAAAAAAAAEATPPPEETEEERLERERLEDIAERDAFAARIRDKDKDKTKKLVADKSSAAADSEVAKRLSLADDREARNQALPGLRDRARQEYLTKREAQQMDLLRLEIVDEENLFHGMKMTAREERELERKKELLRIMEERQRIDDGTDGYQMPDDYITEQGKLDAEKKRNVLYKRYEEAGRGKTGSLVDRKDEKEKFMTDIDQWERRQTEASTFKTGALDKVAIEEQYDFVRLPPAAPSSSDEDADLDPDRPRRSLTRASRSSG
jgi:pre-mRNA-splicing factor ATP-dependent RNA helicase DHX16